jgi:hypothetical protein
MTAWRMAFRVGQDGYELWPECHRLGVAVIEYGPVDDIDLSRYSEGEPRSAWSQLAPPQQTSLKRFVYEMQEHDVIYVKQGPMIVGKGVVTGPYRFDKKNRIQDPNGTPWQHQRRVTWEAGFPEVRIQIGPQQVMTLATVEIRRYAHILRGVIEVLKPGRVVSIGKHAARALHELGIAAEHVRHPSRGGAPEFKSGVRRALSNHGHEIRRGNTLVARLQRE